MYLPEIDFQQPLTDLNLEVSPQQGLSNVTKDISDILRLCETAGFDPHGMSCGLSVFLPSRDRSLYGIRLRLF